MGIFSFFTNRALDEYKMAEEKKKMERLWAKLDEITTALHQIINEHKSHVRDFHAQQKCVDILKEEMKRVNGRLRNLELSYAKVAGVAVAISIAIGYFIKLIPGV